MFLPTLYAKSSTGKVLEWRIEYSGSSYRTHTGQQGGAVITSEWSQCEAKSVGRSNSTTSEKQAEKEAKALWKKKIKSHGYWEDIADIDKQTFIEPMLANKFKDHKHKVKYPVMVDRKYNGMRQVTSIDKAKTRMGEKIETAPHILNAIDHLFKKYPNLVLDGELYNHEYRYKLNELMSIVRKQKDIILDDLLKSSQIVKYYVYDGYGWDDITEETPCATRRICLGTLLRDIPEIVVVPFDWAANEEEVMKLYDSHVSDGYEGAIIRANTKYWHKRTNDLLKVKPLDDDEFEILEVLEGTGNWSGAAKIVTLKFKENDTFKASVKGSYESGVEILKNKNNWIGKTVTIFYNGFTGLGKPNYAQLDPKNCFKGDRKKSKD